MSKRLKPLIRSGGIYPTEGITPLVRGNGFMKVNNSHTDNSKEQQQPQEQQSPKDQKEPDANM